MLYYEARQHYPQFPVRWEVLPTYLLFYPLPALDGEFMVWKGILTDF